MEQLFGHDKRIQTVLELSSDFCGSHRTATEAGCVPETKQSLLGNVVEQSKETGTWISDISSIVGKVIGNGQENDVFLSADAIQFEQPHIRPHHGKHHGTRFIRTERNV